MLLTLLCVCVCLRVKERERDRERDVCVCVCVCVRERKRERISFCACVAGYCAFVCVGVLCVRERLILRLCCWLCHVFVCMLIFRVSLLLFCNNHVLLCFGHWWRRISHTLGTPGPKKSYHHSGPSSMSPNEPWICPDNGATGAKVPGRHRGSCGSVRRGRGGVRYRQRRSQGKG